jgi:hypothetical protein
MEAAHDVAQIARTDPYLRRVALLAQRRAELIAKSCLQASLQLRVRLVAPVLAKSNEGL